MADKYTVMVAIDNSQQAQTAFDYYIKNVHRADNQVLVVHCMEFPHLPYEPMREELLMSLLEKAKEVGKEVDDKYNKQLQTLGVKGKVISDFGKPGEYLVNAAKTNDANLVVMGTRGQGTVRRTIFGSVSDYVLHHAHCPVLIFRH